MLHPFGAAITFFQPAVPAKTRRAEWAGHGTAVAADAVGVVVNGKAGLLILSQAVAGTCRDTGGIVILLYQPAGAVWQG